MADEIIIKGARQHNLKNISVSLPKNKLVVFTGLSGSGKSSLAFDTIYAEGQRRYVESLSSYARQFLGVMDKPDVDQIIGLSPAIAIDQKSVSHNPRSTVGTITEIYDYLRLLYARIGRPHCPSCGAEISQQSLDQITQGLISLIRQNLAAKTAIRCLILSPVIRNKKGEFTELFKNLKSKGFQKIRLDGRIHDLNEDLVLIKTNRHTIEAVIERISFSRVQLKDSAELKLLSGRLAQALESALTLADGLAILSFVNDPSLVFPEKPTQFADHLFSNSHACPKCNLSLPEIEPRLFSFNSPQGACDNCSGLGTLLKIDPQKIIAPGLTLAEGAIIPFASQLATGMWLNQKLTPIADFHAPWNKLTEKVQQQILYGTVDFEGIVNNMERRFLQTESDFIRHEFMKYMNKTLCPKCQGRRLTKEALSITLDKLNIYELTSLSIKDTYDFLQNLSTDSNRLTSKEKQIGALILKEILIRLKFLLSVGLDYLSLNRESATLAGGEAQRIRLASQIGSGLTNVLYVLDEPSIGLHQRDNQRLINTLNHLRDLGNTIIVVEHDREIMVQCDHILDFGPLAGKNGGEIIFNGTPKAILTSSKSLTGKYLSGKKQVSITSTHRQGINQWLTLSGCTEHNLKNLTVKFALNQLNVITGVSGSGKSTLIHDTLYHALRLKLGYQETEVKNNYQEITGFESITKVTLIDQSPIGRTPRSNPATYTKSFDFIRELFSQTKDAKIHGFNPGRFSFNVRTGRCEACQGEGQVKIEMQFMADVYITCEVCHGSRYNTQTLEVKYQDKNIAEVLNLTVDEAIKFFPHYSPLHRKLTTLQAVGLGYIALGQPAPTLSGGEAQRIKLAKELAIHGSGHTLYLLDEPTTGLHFEDLNKLLFVLKELVAQGNTVIVIEHNLDIIKNADWIIDLGPEGGDQGGKLIANGTPKEIASVKQSYTGQYLKKIL